MYTVFYKSIKIRNTGNYFGHYHYSNNDNNNEKLYCFVGLLIHFAGKQLKHKKSVGIELFSY